jgi:hypothetical protein
MFATLRDPVRSGMVRCALFGEGGFDHGGSERAGEVPLLMIDGRPFTWDQVGRMLMSFEGFTLRAFVSDRIEVVGGPLLDKEEA